MVTEKKSPAVRFAGFTEDWEEKEFNNIFNFSTGRNIKQNEASPAFETPCVRYGELYHMYNEVIDKIINRTDLDKSELKFSVGNEILLPSAGEDPLDIGSASALTIPNVAIGRTINILSPKNDSDYSQIFVSYYINTKLRVKIASLAKGVSISNVYNSDLRDLKINLPTLNEQNRIGDFLQYLDKLIAKHKTQLTKLKNLKKAMLTKMFPQNGASVPEIRFKGFDGEWEEKTIESLGEVVTGSTPSTAQKSFYSKSGIPWVTPTDIKQNITYSTSKHLSEEGQKVARVVPKNSILITCIASIGKNTLLGTQGSLNQQINALVPYEKENYYYYLFISSYFWSIKMKNIAAKGTMQIVNKNEFSQLKTLVPGLKEQRKIGDYFKNLDGLVENHNEQLKKLNNIKKACLSKLFVA